MSTRTEKISLLQTFAASLLRTCCRLAANTESVFAACLLQIRCRSTANNLPCKWVFVADLLQTNICKWVFAADLLQTFLCKWVFAANLMQTYLCKLICLLRVCCRPAATIFIQINLSPACLLQTCRNYIHYTINECHVVYTSYYLYQCTANSKKVMLLPFIK